MESPASCQCPRSGSLLRLPKMGVATPVGGPCLYPALAPIVAVCGLATGACGSGMWRAIRGSRAQRTRWLPGADLTPFRLPHLSPNEDCQPGSRWARILVFARVAGDYHRCLLRMLPLGGDVGAGHAR